MAQSWMSDDDDLSRVVEEADRRGWIVGPAVRSAADEVARKRTALRDRIAAIVTLDRVGTARSATDSALSPHEHESAVERTG